MISNPCIVETCRNTLRVVRISKTPTRGPAAVSLRSRMEKTIDSLRQLRHYTESPSVFPNAVPANMRPHPVPVNQHEKGSSPNTSPNELPITPTDLEHRKQQARIDDMLPSNNFAKSSLWIPNTQKMVKTSPKACNF